MKSIILKIIVTFAMFVLLMVADRCVFMAVYGGGESFSDLAQALAGGLQMDCCVAGYLTVIPALLAVARIWSARRWIGVAEKVYYYVAGMLLAAIFVLDTVLYGYWGFRLDMTPIFYYTSSPGAAMASSGVLAAAGGLLAVVAAGLAVAWLLRVTAGRIAVNVENRRVGATIAGALLTLLLFIPIRGGFTVSTMNMSRAYFSTDMRLNHIAVNPAFSLLYSASHQSGFNRQFRFYGSDAEAAAHLPEAAGDCAADSLSLTHQRPDIYLIILESFSAHLMPSLGGEAVALNLDSIARSGVMWTDFYANSFRTDRALPAILSGFPSQPTVSIMKYVGKAEKLPGIAAELKRQGGYETAYYYGGDANFTNMLAYLRAAGFDRIVSDRDFPISERLSKWGAHDDVLFSRVLRDEAAAGSGGAPMFTVVQTSSSHEPFEVPAHFPRFAGNERQNAFAYTDSCLRQLVNGIDRPQRPRPVLIVIVPDHYGAWPPRDSLPDFAQRHHVPLVMTGSALGGRRVRFETTGSQNDIAATLLGLLGMDSEAFPFSHNLLDPSVPHFGWITEPELAAILSCGRSGAINISTNRPEAGADSALTAATKAQLQLIYTALGD